MVVNKLWKTVANIAGPCMSLLGQLWYNMRVQ